MSDRTLYDVVIIGAGPAGYCAAIRLAQLGFSVVVVDKRTAMGGTCLNVGCIPSKALLDSSEHFVVVKNGLAQHGIKVENVSLDLGIMMQRKDRVVATFTSGIETLLRQNHIDIRQGTARFAANPGEIEIDFSGTKSKVRANRAVIVATGSEPSVLSSIPINNARKIGCCDE